MQDEHAFALDSPDQLVDYIRDVQERDKAYTATEALTRREPREANRTATVWEVDHRGVLQRNGKVWIPEHAVLRANLMKNHDDPMGGHYRVYKTINLLKMKYWWPQAQRDVAEYIKRCAVC
jgi:hypothetical protein